MIKLYRRITMIIKLIFESIRFAFGSLKGDKFRTFLSLFGVSIGIFSIVTVFTAVGALQKNVESGLNSFGGNTVYVQQFPFAPPEGEEYKWWEYMNRPMPKYEEYLFLKTQSKTIAATSFVVFTNRTVTYKRASFNSGFITAATYEWGEIANTEIDRGRYFSQFEAQSSTPVVILGNEVANALCGFENPINKVIKFEIKCLIFRILSYT